ncbi:Ribonucleotide reductase of class III (anaerobic), activating protein [Gilliamella apicola]|uniref:4Fe-4S single cluster domain-containing protein n=1 Tax=Gilliamella apicola TaxID=1196095 RepID=UPI00042E8DFA|nr:4Fe-4S single cluster domain-containing protein [Gilliamella apicola]AHN25216.1 Ribonucleotide reductase of class III (anaerobic), activating protein [Gilliamella apicola]PXV86026.1 anaerobic ribonucleoside-triphosphate reductase activating protein [Gilliamella apicola]
MLKVGISRVHFPVTTLGPGKRLGIWFQGCSLRCEGCISVDTWATAKTLIPIDQLMMALSSYLPLVDGITISGGEPFDQFDALLAIVAQLREKTKVDILVYTGYSIEDIPDQLQQIKPYIDVLISDPFQRQTSQTLRLRGSDNQRLHCFTSQAKEKYAYYQQVVTTNDNVLDVMFDAEGVVWFAGIPKRDDFIKLQTILKQQGHQLKVSADKVKY